MTHEIAHVKNRDPLTTLSTGMTFSVLMGMITGSDGSQIQVAVSNLTQLSFSRRQESLADKDAIAALQAYYGHTFGAEAFFQHIFTLQNTIASPVEFFQTHPGTQKRTEAILTSQANQPPQRPRLLPEAIKRIQNN